MNKGLRFTNYEKFRKAISLILFVVLLLNLKPYVVNPKLIFAQNPTSWQQNATGLKTTGNTDKKTGGLGFIVQNQGWPYLYTQGGVQNGGYGYITGPMDIDLGFVKYPNVANTSSVLSSETADWSGDHLVFNNASSSQLDVWASRLSPAVLVKSTQSTTRFLSGNLLTYKLSGGTFTVDGTNAPSYPKYVAYHASGAIQVKPLSTTSLSLSGIDQNWLLVWYGGNSHFLETKIPILYPFPLARGSTAGGVYGTSGNPINNAYQADVPLLLNFQDTPASIVQSSEGGVDVSVAAGYSTILPVMGRDHPAASTTDIWTSGSALPTTLINKISFWTSHLCSFPISVSESYSYNSSTDTSSITENITYLSPICGSGGGTTFATLPPFLSVAKNTFGSAFSISGTVVDGQLPTDFGPTLGIENTSSYTWSLSGLKKYTDSQRILGTGSVPADVTTELNSQVDKVTAAGHLAPWLQVDKMPRGIHETGSLQFLNTPDSINLLSEIIPALPSGSSQRTNLLSYLKSERANYPPESMANVPLNQGSPRLYSSQTESGNSPPDQPVVGPYSTLFNAWTNYRPDLFMTRPWLYNFFALSRYYDVTGDTVSPTVTTDLKNSLDLDMQNQDWATMYWFLGSDDRRIPVVNANRHMAGLIGAVKLSEKIGDTTTEYLSRNLLAKAAILRTAMATYTNYIYSNNLVQLPTDPAWQPKQSAGYNWLGLLYNYNWASVNDDARQIVTLSQFGQRLFDSSGFMTPYTSWSNEALADSPYLIAFRELVPETARFLADYVKSNVDIYANKYETIVPHWYAGYSSEGMLGVEHGLSEPTDSYQIFLANAWIDGASPVTLARYADTSWLGVGDFFYMHKLAETVKAYEGVSWSPVGGGTCTRNCTGKQCGPDGCGGTCGSCVQGQTCNPSGSCVQVVTAPTNLTVTSTTSNSVGLSWTAATTTNTSISTYNIFQNNVQVSQTTGTTTTYTTTGLSPSTTYSYYVTATDNTGITGPASNTVSATTLAATPPPGAMSIVNITDNSGSYPGGQIPKFEKYEVTFSVNGTQATNLFFPYDANPPDPTGEATASGITVNAVFKSPSAVTTTQPAFYYQDFNYQVLGGRDWFYPTNNFSWKVRFTPNEVGTWSYYLTATDEGGTVQSTSSSFTVTNSLAGSHGFVQVAKKDPRYFEFNDGTYFPALSYNMNYENIDWDSPIQHNTANFQKMGGNGIQVIRHWLSQWGIFSSNDVTWASMRSGPDNPGQSMNLPYSGSDSSMRVQKYWNPCLALGAWKEAPAAKQNTKYWVFIRYVIPTPIPGTSAYDSTKPYGFAAKLDGWIDPPSSTNITSNCASPGTGTDLFTPITNSPTNSSGVPQYGIVTGSFNSGTGNYMPNLYLVMENVDNWDQPTTAPEQAFIDRVEVREDAPGCGPSTGSGSQFDLSNGSCGVNIVSRPWAAFHESIDQKYSYSFDQVLNLAKQSGVYLKLVGLEKNEWIQDRINWSGYDDPNNPSNNNFYGNSTSPTKISTKVNWLQKAWWRYMQARWGYSPNIHSWELINEGDPFSGLHYAQADQFALYMHQFGPDSHLVTTSNWNAFPVSEFWRNSSYPDLDYTDVHQYIFQGQNVDLRVDDGTTSYIHLYDSNNSQYNDSAVAAKVISDAIGAKQPYGVGKPVMRGETGFVTSGNTSSPDPVFVNDTQGIWLHNYVWAGINSSGLIESYWYDVPHIYSSTTNPTYDRRNQYGNFYRFISAVPLNNGNYIDSAAATSAAGLRAWGQKDLVNGNAHLWIQNADHTWNNVVNNAAISPKSGSVTIPGFTANQTYNLTWWNTYTGVVDPSVCSAQPCSAVTADSAGNIILNVSNLSTDVAVKISLSGGGCIKNCSGKSCGPDGCGGSCGTCSPGQACSVLQACVSAAPGAPINLAANAVSSTAINLAWTAAAPNSVTNALITGTTIYRGGIILATASGTTFADTGLSPSTTYSYQVQAVDNLGNVSSLSTAASATTQAVGCIPNCAGKTCGPNGCGGTCPPGCPISGTVCSSSGTSCLDVTPPSVPTGLSATVSAGPVVGLSWNAATDNVGVTGYNIIRGGSKLTAITATSYLDPAVNYATTYTYQVSAFDAAGNSSPLSAAVTITTPPAPCAPSCLGKSCGDNGCGGSCGTCGNGQSCDPTSFSCVAPLAIITLSASPSASGAVVNWTTNNNSSTQAMYDLLGTPRYVSPLVLPGVTNHSVTISGLLPCTTYIYGVRSVDALGSATTSGISQFTTTGCTGNSPILGYNGLQVSSASGGLVPLVSYGRGLQLSVGGNYATMSAQFQIHHLERGPVMGVAGVPSGFGPVSDHVYEVEALDDINLIQPSFLAPITVSVLYAPADLPAGVSPATLRIYRWDGASWQALSSCTTNLVANTVTCTTTAFSTFVLMAPSASVCTPTCSTSNTCGSDGCGGICGLCNPGFSCTGNVCLAAVISAPDNLTASPAGPSEIDLSWSASTSSASVVSGYEIYRNGNLVATALGTSFADTGLSAATSYSYFLIAHDSFGNRSGRSAVVSVTTSGGGVGGGGSGGGGGGGGGGGSGGGGGGGGGGTSQASSGADLDGDGRVDIFDLSILLSNWGGGGRGDLNGDGVVDIFDLSILLSAWTG